MKHVFVGDIHGRVDHVKSALDRDGQIIFVGDFQDSWSATPEQHGQCFRLVIDAVRAGKARCLYGNHELSYMFKHHRCSGYDAARSVIFQAYEPEIKETFEPFIILGDVLVTHAGLTKQLWDRYMLSKDLLGQVLAEWWPDMGSPMHYIGQARGGPDRWGGTFWCDFNNEFVPVPGLTQVFGHTSGREIRRIEDSYCIDCLEKNKEPTFLELDL